MGVDIIRKSCCNQQIALIRLCELHRISKLVQIATTELERRETDAFHRKLVAILKEREVIGLRTLHSESSAHLPDSLRRIAKLPASPFPR